MKIGLGELIAELWFGERILNSSAFSGTASVSYGPILQSLVEAAPVSLEWESLIVIKFKFQENLYPFYSEMQGQCSARDLCSAWEYVDCVEEKRDAMI